MLSKYERAILKEAARIMNERFETQIQIGDRVRVKPPANIYAGREGTVTALMRSENGAEVLLDGERLTDDFPVSVLEVVPEESVRSTYGLN
jgi:hypothetical protein